METLPVYKAKYSACGSEDTNTYNDYDYPHKMKTVCNACGHITTHSKNKKKGVKRA